MVLSIKTTLKYLLNSRFIIIYRFQPNSHSKMAAPPANTHTNPPTKSSKPYSPKSSLLAFWLVTSITSCVSSPLICASFSATYFILRLSFLLPRLGSGAQATIKMWPSVRRGEEQNIFPYQDSADTVFNSSLIYETALLKPYVQPLLFGVPRGSDEYLEAKRLLKFLDYFLPVPADDVPQTSLMREFVGGGIYKT